MKRAAVVIIGASPLLTSSRRAGSNTCADNDTLIVLIRSKPIVSTNEIQWPLDDRNAEPYIPILIEVIRPNRSLSWVITAQRHKPSQRFLASFDEVHRRTQPGRFYWVCIRGGTLSADAVNGLIRSHQSMTEGWEQVDLRQFN